MQEDLLDQKAVCAFFGGTRPIHFATLYRGIAAGRYPKPIHVAPNTSRWLRSECYAALKRIIEVRDNFGSPNDDDREEASSQGHDPQAAPKHGIKA